MNNKEKYNGGCVANDVEIAREAEELAMNILSRAFKKAEFESVHDEKELWHYGDVVMTKKEKQYFIDVKDDGCIHRTGNIFAENYKKFYNNYDVEVDGWIKSTKCDYLAILDQVDRNLYLVDCKKLQKIYKYYPLRKSELSDCSAWGNCVPLRECKKQNILICTIKYELIDDEIHIKEKIPA